MEHTIISRSAAKSQGLTKYFTGKPCKHGHIAVRWTASASCAACAAHRHREKYHTDPEYRENMLAQQREDYHNNPAAAARKIARSKERYANDPEYREKVQQRSRAYHLANPDRPRKPWAEWTPEQRERQRIRNSKAVAKYAKANPEKTREIRQQRRATKLNAIPLRAFKGKREATRQANYERLQARLKKGSSKVADLLCPDYRQRVQQLFAECLRLSEFLGVDMHLDHKISLAAGGEHHPDNLWPLEAGLNLRKNAKSLGIDWTPPTPTFEQVTWRTHR